MTAENGAAAEGATGGRRAISAWLLALVAPLALIFGGRPSSEKALRSDVAAPPPAPRPDADISHCIERFADPIQGLTGLSVEHEKDWRGMLQSARAALTSLAGPAGIHTMIATVADPIDSGLVYMYDEQLQGLELAMEVPLPGRARAVRYYRDRSWLPWDDRYEEGEGRKKSEYCREQTPGLLLLRGDAGVMVLLLVGESPTVGVHRQAMDQALVAEAILNAQTPRGCVPGQGGAAEGCTRIVGPTFSGTASSLARALHTRPEVERGVQIISGTASGPDVPSLLRGHTPAERGLVTYQATTVPEEAAQCQYLYLVERLAHVFHGDAEMAHAVEGAAILSESGTEFGTSLSNGATAGPDMPGASHCPLQPEVRLAFPFHVAALRDAYADQDKLAPTADVAHTIARRTSLPVSLHEGRTALDVPANPSPKTIFAQDVALSHVLSEISREGIRYVAIEATDAADSIFLAQKIRDVAPDVRLVFLDADALLIHPDFERTLLGSFVISPYPFFGADDFVPRRLGTPSDDASVEPHSHALFESAIDEGVFNAGLAQRGADPDQLEEYVFSRSRTKEDNAAARLPLWVSVIGHGELTPVITHPAVDCAETIFGRQHVPGQELLCARGSSAAQRAAGWNQFNALRIQSLEVDPDVTPPRFWHFVFAALLLAWSLDRYFGNRLEHRMDCRTERGSETLVTDRQIDVTVGRTKILFYLFVRRIALFSGLLYMTAVYWVAWHCYNQRKAGVLTTAAGYLVTIVIVVAACASCRGLYRRFQREYLLLGSWRERLLPDADYLDAHAASSERAWLGTLQTWWASAQRWLGFYPLVHRHATVYTPYAQVRLLRGVVFSTALAFAVGLFFSVSLDADLPHWRLGPVPALTLFVLRTLPLANGVSFAAPFLLAIACVYLWAFGRAARLSLVHGLSRMTPEDGLLDGVSTPICMILYPADSDEPGSDADPSGFGRQERALLHAVWSPSTSSWYFGAMLVISFFPFVLFTLKPPSSLERRLDTLLLAAAVGICGVIVSATLIQLYQYWRTFGALLRRIANHPLAESFKDVLPFVREDIDAQISRPPNDLTRLVACANAYRSLPDPKGGLASATKLVDSKRLLKAANEALRLSSQKLDPATIDAQSRLGRNLVEAASALQAFLLHPKAQTTGTQFNTAARSWIATVVAIILNRHIRQFRHLLYSMTGCAVILLMATLSYPFEPQRAILTCLWGLTLTVVFSGLGVFVMMNRDTLLSYITQSEPGRLDINAALVTRVVQWVVIPMLLLAAAQYPDLANAAFRWVDPMLHALR